MRGRDELNAADAERRRGRPTGHPATMPPVEALAALSELLGLDQVGVMVTAADVYGRGGTASATLRLSTGDSIVFESLRDMGTANKLAIEIAAAVGVVRTFKTPEAVQAVALIRRCAKLHESFTADQVAFDIGTTWLQESAPMQVDMNDQAARWRAFAVLNRAQPDLASRQHDCSFVAACTTLVGLDGTRYVRAGWFYAFAHRQDATIGGNDRIAIRMQRVGWRRRGKHGRTKATEPMSGTELIWSFFEVPEGWEKTTPPAAVR